MDKDLRESRESEPTPGERLAKKAGFLGDLSEEFEEIMKEVLDARRDQAPRRSPEFES